VKKIYLAGKMTGEPNFAFPKFNAMAATLRAQGHEVFNPAERDIMRHGGVDISNPTGSREQVVKEHGFSIREALADDTAYLCKEADAIALIPGWEKGRGSRAEHALAVALDLEIIYLTGLE
jgi:Domain of unknown function (DUF4406)